MRIIIFNNKPGSFLVLHVITPLSFIGFIDPMNLTNQMNICSGADELSEFPSIRAWMALKEVLK